MKIKTKHIYLLSGEPFVFELDELHNIVCCDCGLVHSFIMKKIGKNKIIMKFFRNDFATEFVRRKKKK